MLGAYQALALPFSWRLVVSERAVLSEIYNRQFRASPDLDWYGVGADDIEPEPGWDHELIRAAGKDKMAFGDDGINGDRHATHFVLGGDLVRAMGWLALPGLDRIYIDTVWNDIAERLGVRRYLPDVKVTHRHFSTGAPKDSTYRKRHKARDREIYEQWRAT